MRPAVPSARARRYLDLKIDSQMQTTITITRPTAPTFDSTTGMVTAHASGTVVYSGPCRVYPVSGGQQVNLGDGIMVLRTTTISIPQETTPRVNDMVTVNSSPDDTVEVGKQFRILDVTMGGVLDPTRKLSCSDWEPNSFHTQA